MEWVKNNYSVILDDPIARSIIIAFSSVLIAKLSDVIFVSIIKKMSDFRDDEIMDMARDLYGRGMQGRLGSTNSAEEEEKYLRALMAVERLFPGQM